MIDFKPHESRHMMTVNILLILLAFMWFFSCVIVILYVVVNPRAVMFLGDLVPEEWFC